MKGKDDNNSSMNNKLAGTTIDNANVNVNERDAVTGKITKYFLKIHLNML